MKRAERGTTKRMGRKTTKETGRRTTKKTGRRMMTGRARTRGAKDPLKSTTEQSQVIL